MREIVSIWKAPRKEVAKKLVTSGFRPAYFKGAPGQLFDGKAYFAKERRLAQMYAEIYGCGIIEVLIPKADYHEHFQKFEEPYQGGDEIQVPIPRDFLDQFNTMTIRRIWHHDEEERY